MTDARRYRVECACGNWSSDTFDTAEQAELKCVGVNASLAAFYDAYGTHPEEQRCVARVVVTLADTQIVDGNDTEQHA